MFKHFPFLKYQINMKENRDNPFYPKAFCLCLCLAFLLHQKPSDV